MQLFNLTAAVTDDTPMDAHGGSHSTADAVSDRMFGSGSDSGASWLRRFHVKDKGLKKKMGRDGYDSDHRGYRYFSNAEYDAQKRERKRYEYSKNKK